MREDPGPDPYPGNPSDTFRLMAAVLDLAAALGAVAMAVDSTHPGLGEDAQLAAQAAWWKHLDIKRLPNLLSGGGRRDAVRPEDLWHSHWRRILSDLVAVGDGVLTLVAADPQAGGNADVAEALRRLAAKATDARLFIERLSELQGIKPCGGPVA